MLIYQAQSYRNSRAFTSRDAAILWVQQNTPVPGSYWKRISPDCEVLCSGSSGHQVGAVYEVQLETAGETDPLRELALKILAGDPQACDAARDILKS